MAVLVIDACELVVEFLGASKDCARLGATCREWRVHVLHSRVWCEPLRALAPVTCRRLLQDERTQYEQHGAFRYRARWYSEYAAARQAKPTQCFFTNLPEARRTEPPVTHGRVQAALDSVRCVFGASAPRNVCVIGFPGAGTATIVSRAGTPPEDSPGNFMHMRSHDPVRNIRFVGWHVGGQQIIRPLWGHLFAQNSAGVVLVVDAHDRGSIDRLRQELWMLLDTFKEEIGGAPWLILVTKHDIAGGMPPEVVADELGLSDVGSDAFDFCVQGCSGVENVGIAEGLDWLAGAIARRAAKHATPAPRRWALRSWLGW
jgi:GTPase SAR1 family protein